MVGGTNFRKVLQGFQRTGRRLPFFTTQHAKIAKKLVKMLETLINTGFDVSYDSKRRVR
jgi:hypothetical protein